MNIFTMNFVIQSQKLTFTMKTLPCFSSHEHNITTSEKHSKWRILPTFSSQKENSLASQTERARINKQRTIFFKNTWRIQPKKEFPTYLMLTIGLLQSASMSSKWPPSISPGRRCKSDRDGDLYTHLHEWLC